MIFQHECLFPYFYALHTGNGISDEYHVIRHVMNLEAVNTYEGERSGFSFLFFAVSSLFSLAKISLSELHCQADILLSHGNVLGRVCGHIPDKNYTTWKFECDFSQVLQQAAQAISITT